LPQRIAKLQEALQAQLPDDFLRLGNHLLLACEAVKIKAISLSPKIKAVQLMSGKRREAMLHIRILEDGIECGRLVINRQVLFR
jgi:hypothetical protein